MATTETTQEQWLCFMGNDPGGIPYYHPQRLTHPAGGVSWRKAQAFIKKLNETLSFPGWEFRLPTEAEWEHACLAGQPPAGLSEEELNEIAWHRYNCSRLPVGFLIGRVYPVGQKKPNDWGLYDMFGNVNEWCLDNLTDYPGKNPTDPIGETKSDIGIGRGGSVAIPLPPSDISITERVGTSRIRGGNFWGFRIVLAPIEEKPPETKD